MAPTKRPSARTSSLGLVRSDPLEVVDLIREGFAYRRLRDFQEASGLSTERVARATRIPTRTLSRRQASGRLTSEESDRLYRVARVFDLAVALFEGDADGARAWMESSQPALGGEVPLDLVATDAGARAVERLILQLEHGVFA